MFVDIGEMDEVQVKDGEETRLLRGARNSKEPEDRRRKEGSQSCLILEGVELKSCWG